MAELAIAAAGAFIANKMKKKPAPKPAIAMPDEEALRLAARRRGALRARRSGRTSTILESPETLG